MAFPAGGGFPTLRNSSQQQSSGRTSSSTTQGANAPNAPPPFQENQFDLFEWYPKFQSCVRYFLDHAQHSGPVQAVAAFVNIQLPCQKLHDTVTAYRPTGSASAVGTSSSRPTGNLPVPVQTAGSVSLVPYIRRLVATGFDHPDVLHSFFGDDWAAGVGHLHEVERRNYLFASKSANWLEVKSHYSMPDNQDIPFLKPLQNATEAELKSAEGSWSDWLLMQDWVIGPRCPWGPTDVPMAVKTEDD